MQRRPNFVFIMADDLGHADLGCYGGRAIASDGTGGRAIASDGAGGRSDCSPELDRLAAQGLRFTDGYSNSPVCSPTRFGLITGRYHYRLRGSHDEPIATRTRGNPVLGLSPSHPTFPSLLRDAGYRTALSGKWHLGFPPHFGPLRSGYQEFFGPLAGGVDYFSYQDSAGVRDLWEGEAESKRTGYLTDLISDAAVDFIGRQKGAKDPFLLSVHYTAPHWPWETRDDEAESRRIGAKIIHTDGGSVKTYQTMIRHMDEGIGRIAQALQAAGADDNTLVVFTSDNGGERFSDTWPLVGKKMDLLEGGIRVPYIVRWPARVQAGCTTAQTAITMDWAATFLEAAGVKAHPDYPMDGMSLLPTLDSPGKVVDRALYWRMLFRNQKALREGAWKWLVLEGDEFLFDLSKDSRERANLVRRHPERAAAMREKYEAWAKTMPAIAPDAKFSIPYTKADLATPG